MSHGPIPAPHAADQPDRQRLSLAEFTRRLVIAVVVVAVVALLWYAREVFLLAFAGLLLAVLLQTLSRWLADSTPLSYSWSLGVVVIVLIALVALVGWLLGAQIAQQVGQLTKELPTSVQELNKLLQQTEWGRWLSRTVGNAQQATAQSGFVSRMTGFASGIFNFVAAIVIILFVGLYFAAEPRLYTEGIVRMVPMRRRDRAREIIGTLGYILRWWLLGQLITMAAVGILTGAGLWFIGVRLALVLGLLAFFLELVPNIGPILAAIPAVLLAWTQSTNQALYVVLLYIVIQTLESYVILPLVQRQAVLLPPAIVLLAVVLLGLMSGVLGVLVAAPLTISIIVLVKMIYVEDTLGDHSVSIPGASAQ